MSSNTATATVSPNKPRFIPNAQLPPFTNGLRYFALRNGKGSFVIPSTKNFMDDFQIPKIKCDDGATCTILPVKDVSTLECIIRKYKEKSCRFSVVELKSVAGITKAMSIQGRLNSSIFSFRLGLDIFPHVRKIERNVEGEFSSTEEQNDEAPIESGNALLYEPLVVCNCVNFFLCSDDIDHILSRTELRDVFGSDPFLQQYERTIHRRDSALLGSDFLGITRCSINFDRARFFFDPLIHSLEGCSWTTFEDLCDEIKKMRYLKSGTVDFEVLDSIEPNDIFELISGEDPVNPYDYEQEV
jgi:hypothetical protein